MALLVLDTAKELTGSSLGFAAHLDPVRGWFALAPMSGDHQPDSDARLASADFKGWWDWVLQHRQPLLANTPGLDPRAIDLPVGLAPIHNILAVPALSGGELVGEIVVANAPRNYTEEDQLVLEQLADLYAHALRREREHANLRLFRALMDCSNDAFFIVDPDTGRFIDINAIAHQRLGYSREEMLGMGVTDISATATTPELWLDQMRHFRATGGLVFESGQIKKDGTVMPVAVNVRFIRHDGREYLVAVARDITERKQAQDRLIEGKNKLEAVLASLGDGLTMQDLDFRVVYQSDAHKERQGDLVPKFRALRCFMWVNENRACRQ